MNIRQTVHLTALATHQHAVFLSAPLLVCMHPGRPYSRYRKDSPVSSFCRRELRADVHAE